MEHYTPPFQITNEMLLRVSAISEKLGKISITGNLETRPHLRRNNRIQSIHSSLRIEANSLSLGQVRDVIGGKLVLGEQLEIQEVKNAYAAYERLSELDPYSLNELLQCHGVMTRFLVEESGVFRRGQEGVFSGGECIFMAPPAKLVPELTEQLFRWLRRARNEVHPLIMASVFHYEFVFIHPFSDGNGRMARLWHTALLMQWNPIFEYVPIESRIERYQEEYYAAIASCHKAGNSNAFILFMLKMIDGVLDDFLQQVGEGEELSEYVKRLLAVMEYQTPYSLQMLMDKLGIRSRESFRKHYMHPALSLGLVRMTIPEKPRSKNQRYIKI